MEWLTQSPMAHRGLHKGFNVPENSYKAFKRAIDKKLSIELDVRMTKDKQIVVFHDKNLIRMCAVRKKVPNQNYEAIKDIPLYKTNQKIPLLTDILELIDGKVPLVIEVKNYGTVGEFENVLAQILDNYKGDFAICSFNPNVVHWFKKNRPEIIRGMVFGDLKKFQISFYKTVFLYRLFKLRPHFISLDYKLLDTVLPAFCRWCNKPIVSWTIDSKKKLKKAREIVDNIIFENIKV